MQFLSSTPVTRSWTRTLAALLFALVVLGLACLVVYLNRAFGGVIGALICLIGFLAGLLTAMTHSYTGACPACGSPQKRLGGIHRCNHCLAYGEVVKGEYCELEPDRVVKSPVFAARVTEPCFMPRLCCACGAPSTRFQRLRIIRKEFAFNLDVPHCDLHTGGADLATEQIKNGKVWNEIPVIKVASYRVYCEFLKQNAIGNDRAAQLL
jgi:hypothetical protein